MLAAPQKFFLNLLICRESALHPRHNYNIPSLNQLVVVQTENFLDAAADLVAVDCLS
jgi:hypothetical protein